MYPLLDRLPPQGRAVGTRALFAAAAFLLLNVTSSAQAASVGYFQDWNDADRGVAGWTGTVALSSASWQATGGNGGGYLRTTLAGGGGTADVGGRALSNVPEMTGDFRELFWTMQFDIRLEGGSADAAMLRLQGISTGNGWVLDLPTGLPTSSWSSVLISFNGNWTESEARDNGWMPDNEHPVLSPNAPASLSWEATVENVRALAIRISGESEQLTSGLDNVRLDGTSAPFNPIPEPSAALLLGLGLLGLAGFSQRN